MTDMPAARGDSTREEHHASVLSFDNFNVLYRALTNHGAACCWQRPLSIDLEAGRFPTGIERAIGLGKTRDVRRRKNIGQSR